LSKLRFILQKFGQDSIKIIEKNSRSAGQPATGDTLRSLKSDAKETDQSTRLEVSGPMHVMVLETGRGPYAGGPESNLQKKIEIWMRAKPVQPRDGQTIQQAAKGITWYINKFGTELYRKGGRKDIITPALRQKRFDELETEIGNFFLNKTISNVQTAIDGTT